MDIITLPEPWAANTQKKPKTKTKKKNTKLKSQLSCTIKIKILRALNRIFKIFKAMQSFNANVEQEQMNITKIAR